MTVLGSSVGLWNNLYSTVQYKLPVIHEFLTNYISHRIWVLMNDQVQPEKSLSSYVLRSIWLDYLTELLLQLSACSHEANVTFSKTWLVVFVQHCWIANTHFIKHLTNNVLQKLMKFINSQSNKHILYYIYMCVCVIYTCNLLEAQVKKTSEPL